MADILLGAVAETTYTTQQVWHLIAGGVIVSFERVNLKAGLQNCALGRQATRTLLVLSLY